MRPPQDFAGVVSSYLQQSAPKARDRSLCPGDVFLHSCSHVQILLLLLADLTSISLTGASAQRKILGDEPNVLFSNASSRENNRAGEIMDGRDPGYRPD
jgi:hypothetical protein